MHPPPRAARPARPPPPLQHPIPTHPRFQVPESPVRSDFSADDNAAYAPASHYTPQNAAAASTQHAYAPAAAAQRAPPKKRETYTRISSPRGTTPVAGHAAQQRTAHPAASQPRPPAHASPAQARGGPYAPPSRSNSAASVVPNMHMYQPASVPSMDGTAAHDNYPHTPTYAAATPPHDPYARSADAWGFGAQPTGTLGPNMASLGGGMMNDATAQMGMQFGRHVAQFRALLPMPMLKHYFNVSNSYVLHKLRIIVFPWRHKPWSRRLRYTTPYGASGIMSPGQSASPTPYAGMSAPDRPLSANGARLANGAEPVSFCPPREDVNSPDMYIPSMAFVTYTIATSAIYGLRGRFHPENLGYTASRALAIVVIEFTAVKLGCYLLNIQGDHTVFDLVAYSGYKFVGTLLVLAVGMLPLGRWAYWLTFLYVFAANAFFLLRSLRYVVLPDPSSPSSVTVTQGQRATRIQFLFAIAMSQIVFGWLLVIGV
ncbi:hypothetical protein CBS9595_002825 [Malassezia furfur]|nr:hypothetical protein CBS9595_002825 [Malassezia furfur]